MDSEMTLFEKVARQYEAGTNSGKGACVNLMRYHPDYEKTSENEEVVFFQNEFKPTKKEEAEYDHGGNWWLTAEYGSKEDYKESTDLRILALLFADIIWREEVLGEDVYD